MPKQVPDGAFVDAVRDHEPAATAEIAEAVGIARQSAGYRLKQLEEQGRVASKKVGPARVWMIEME